jgi:hypothetical protein
MVSESFPISGFGHSNLFRISDFGFRYSDLVAAEGCLTIKKTKGGNKKTAKPNLLWNGFLQPTTNNRQLTLTTGGHESAFYK